tara:strand:+ start:662 stop:1315 length:654 start_codon:yes stop_codon:yes gene_type:complete
MGVTIDSNWQQYILDLPADDTQTIFESIPTAWNYDNDLEKSHKPFAEWLVEELHPKVSVDLGVDFGFSTFVMALASAENTVYGIDGFDLEPAYQKVGKTYTHYEFVTALKEKLKLDNINFIKGYFNDVVKTWDKDIDILHIDGSHDYDSVKEDYENWSPFVKDNGFILFHDTVSHPTSIGKFFNEIGDGYTKINFTHSCGLGVASKNKELMDVITIE